MVPIVSLWLPIILSAVVVFVVSALIHMLLHYHEGDYRRLPDEGAFVEALLKLNIPPGEYYFPRPANREETKTEAWKERVRKGPLGMLSTWPGMTGMAGYFIQWFVYDLVVGIICAYVAGRARGPEAPYLTVFRFVGVTAFTCYAVGLWQNSIWFRKPWSTTLKFTLDGLIYALLTAGIFGWLWPR